MNKTDMQNEIERLERDLDHANKAAWQYFNGYYDLLKNVKNRYGDEAAKELDTLIERYKI